LCRPAQTSSESSLVEISMVRQPAFCPFCKFLVVIFHGHENSDSCESRTEQALILQPFLVIHHWRVASSEATITLKSTPLQNEKPLSRHAILFYNLNHMTLENWIVIQMSWFSIMYLKNIQICHKIPSLNPPPIFYSSFFSLGFLIFWLFFKDSIFC